MDTPPRPPGPPWAAHRREGRWSHRPGPPSIVLTAVLILIQVWGSTGAARRVHLTLPVPAYLLLVAGPLALLLRRRSWPVALVVPVAAAAGYFILGYPLGPIFLAALVAIVGAPRAGYRVLTWVVVATGYLAYALAWLVWPGATRPSVAGLVTAAAWLLVALAAGEAFRVRTQHFAELMRARAERAKAIADQEEARAEHKRRQASDERLRIARELHDVLGHHLSLINVQAGVGLHLMDDKPEQARAALAAIKQASAEALREVRSVLSALRPEDESAPRAPAPSLSGTQDPVHAAGLRALIAEVNAAGLRVELAVTGSPAALPAEVDRAAYRIVQEALTNVRRHAGPTAEATVRLAYGPDDVVVYVTDTGESAVAVPDGEDGSGIVGMRQRVEALGGEFRAGPRAEGGFEVYARFPRKDAP